MKSSIVAFLSQTPILPALQIIVNSALILLALFLLLVLKNTQLHTNCRFLFTLWTMGSLLVFSCHAILGVLNIYDDDGYLPDNIIEPERRNNVYKLEMSVIFFTICLEVMITTERVISSVNPETYYNRDKLAVKEIIPFLLVAAVFAALIGVNCAAGHFVATGMISFWLDVAIISINTYATKYCKRRDAELYGNSALNARYQVKESSDMASAMQPALMISICMKNTVNTTFLASCYALEDENHHCIPLIFELPFGILETLYSLNMSLNGGFLMLWLLRKHPRLRRNAKRLISRLWCSESPQVGSSTLVRVEPQKNEGEVYFDALKRSWM